MTDQHAHNFKIFASNHPTTGRLVFEAFLTLEQQYVFRCDCGDRKDVSLAQAARNGWIACDDIPEPKFNRSTWNHSGVPDQSGSCNGSCCD